MLNSPRRIVGDSNLSFQLFQSKRIDLTDGQKMPPSDVLFAINEQRKGYVQMLTTALFSYMKEQGGKPLDCMIFNARMREGVAGLLSGNFTKKFGLPSIAFGVDAGDSQDVHDNINVDITDRYRMTGSARSPETFDLHGFLSGIDTDYPGLIEKWGGHAQAAGITLLTKNYERFREVFVNRYIVIMSEQMTHQEEPSLIEGEYILTTEAYDRLMQNGATHKSEVVPLHGNTSVFTNQALWDAVRFFEQLEPFGHGFPKPSFSVAIAMRDAPRIFYMGAEKQHAKLMLSNGLTVIHWNGAKLFARPEPVEIDAAGNPVPDDRVFVVTGTLGINRFNGDEPLQFIAADVQDLSGEKNRPILNKDVYFLRKRGIDN